MAQIRNFLVEINNLIISRPDILDLECIKKFMVRFASSTKEYSFKYDRNRDNKDKDPLIIYIDTLDRI